MRPLLNKSSVPFLVDPIFNSAVPAKILEIVVLPLVGCPMPSKYRFYTSVPTFVVTVT